MGNAEKCSIAGCENPVKVKSRSLCNLHYRRWQRHGDPDAGYAYRSKVAEELQRATRLTGDECVRWALRRGKSERSTVRFRGATVSVARAVCFLAHGAPPKDKPEAAHRCGNGHLDCVNAEHLYWASHAENYADRITHGVAQRGERHGLAKLTTEGVRDIKRRLAGGEDKKQIAQFYAVSRQAINDIAAGRRWQWVTP